MRRFIFYIDLDNRGNISEYAKTRLEKYLELLGGYKVLFCWINHAPRTTWRTVSNIIRYERKNCTSKGMILQNQIISDKPTVMAKRIMGIYRVSPVTQEEILGNNEIIRLAFGNKTSGCMFSSCLGNSLYISNHGIGVCPFVDNNIILNNSLDISSIYDVFETDSFSQKLVKQISKRSVCKEICKYFFECKGGCPLSSHQNGDNVCEIKKSVVMVESTINKNDLTNPEILREQVEIIANKYKV